MSHQIKHVTIENGFVKNPDRVYYEEQFELLPYNLKDFVLTTSGNTDFKIHQPANTFFERSLCFVQISTSINRR